MYALKTTFSWPNGLIDYSFAKGRRQPWFGLAMYNMWLKHLFKRQQGLDDLLLFCISQKVFGFFFMCLSEKEIAQYLYFNIVKWMWYKPDKYLETYENSVSCLFKKLNAYIYI